MYSRFNNTFKYIILNNFIASYSTVAIAGIGIAKKVDFLVIAIANGLTQGVLPLIAFNYASGDRKRMLDSIKTTLLYSMIISVSGTLFLFFGAANVTGMFINDADTIAYGKVFLRILSLSGPFLCINFLILFSDLHSIIQYKKKLSARGKH